MSIIPQIYPIFNFNDFQQEQIINNAQINNLSASNVVSSQVSIVSNSGTLSNTATEPWVNTQISNAINTLSGGTLQNSLDTITKIDQAINNDPNFYTDITTSINNVLTEANINQSNITTLFNDVSGINTKLITDEANILTNSNNITTLFNDVSGNTALINNNSNNITTLFNDVSGINTKLIIDEANILTNSNNITTLFNDVSGNTVNILTNANNITNLFNDVSGNTASINTINNNLPNYLTSATASNTYVPLKNANINITEINENVFNGGSGSALSLNYSTIDGVIYFSPSANFTITLINIPTTSSLATYSLTLIYNSKFYANAITVNGTAISMISGGGLSNISINSSAVYVMQQINICFLNSSSPIVITNVLSLF